MYQITTDPARKMVFLKLCGMLTVDEVAAMYADEYRAIRAMGCRRGEHLVLADLTKCNIQMQDVSAALQSLVQQKGTAKRVAMFTGSSLAKMQARRIAITQHAAVFATEEDALAWLFEADERPVETQDVA